MFDIGCSNCENRNNRAQRRHVLVAEDSFFIQQLVCSLLGKAGYTVDLASNGVDALRLAVANEYAFILMDINMPTIDGIEATIMIRALEDPGYAIPIVAMTAETAIDRIEDMAEAGMNGLLGKPFGQAQLCEAIAPWIG